MSAAKQFNIVFDKVIAEKDYKLWYEAVTVEFVECSPAEVIPDFIQAMCTLDLRISSVSYKRIS